MSSVMRTFDIRWHHFDTSTKRSFILRIIVSIAVFIAGLGIIWNLRANTLGEGGSSLAMYSLGVLFIQVCNLGIFYKKLIHPEAFVLKICLFAVIIASAWVNIEENVVMPILASQCETEDCLIIYERHVPFSDAVVTYEPKHGWRVMR